MDLPNREEFTRSILAEDFKTVLSLFDDDPHGVRRLLTRLTYSRDTPEHAGAIVAFRFLSKERSDNHPDFFAETIRRHLWGMNEEGGNIDWSAPEIIGAIIAGNIQRFNSYIPILYNTAAAEPVLNDSLKASLKMIAEVAQEPASTYLAELASTA